MIYQHVMNACWCSPYRPSGSGNAKTPMRQHKSAHSSKSVCVCRIGFVKLAWPIFDRNTRNETKAFNVAMLCCYVRPSTVTPRPHHYPQPIVRWVFCCCFCHVSRMCCVGADFEWLQLKTQIPRAMESMFRCVQHDFDHSEGMRSTPETKEHYECEYNRIGI